jgi:hypothetical protein
MREIIWSNTASLEYDRNIEYLLSDWSEKDALVFIGNVEAILFNLQRGIVEYPLTNEEDARKCVVCKQVTLFYRINTNDDIELLSFWNAYQDPQSLTYKEG